MIVDHDFKGTKNLFHCLQELRFICVALFYLFNNFLDIGVHKSILHAKKICLSYLVRVFAPEIT